MSSNRRKLKPPLHFRGELRSIGDRRIVNDQTRSYCIVGTCLESHNGWEIWRVDEGPVAFYLADLLPTFVFQYAVSVERRPATQQWRAVLKELRRKLYE